MDDPWGSPWADETLQHLPEVEDSDEKRPVTSDKALPLKQASKSPWDDDDRFGEWAALPSAEEIEVPAIASVENIPRGELDAPIVGGPVPKDDDSSDAQLMWFAREKQAVSRSVNNFQTPKFGSGELSPDPWAVEASQLNEETLKGQGALEIVSGATFLTPETSIDSVAYDDSTQGGWDGPDKEHRENKSPPVYELEMSAVKSPVSHDSGVCVSMVEEVAPNQLHAEELTQGESPASRPSSSPSDHSHHDEVLAESPRTSFEDEPKRPKLRTEGSSKVKELVRLFDGLAVEETTVVLEGRSGDDDINDDFVNTPVAEKSEDDFGDFEEGIPYVAANETKTTAEEAEDTMEKAQHHDKPVVPTVIEESDADDPIQVVKVDGAVKFDLNLSLLTQLFGQETTFSQPEDANSREALDIENIIQDSFSSIEQRKTWYRVSRYGTLRKHNAGDGDNYVRINWKDSEVRAKTLKIVARWLEEDRNGGAVGLVGNRPGSLLGWGNTNAAPTTVAAALASKGTRTGAHADSTKSEERMQSSAITNPVAKHSMRTSLEPLSILNTVQSPSSVKSPQFSWSTSTPVPTTAEMGSHDVIPPKSPTNRHQLLSVQALQPEKHNAPPLRAPPAPKASPTHFSSIQPPRLAINTATKSMENTTSQTVITACDKDLEIQHDDEWGEMISSPTVTTVPQALPSDAGHRSPKDLVKVLKPTSANSPQSAQSLQKSTMSCSESIISPRREGNSSLTSMVNDSSAEPKTVSSIILSSDAWASADFSFFDTPVPPPAPAPPLKSCQSVQKVVIPSPDVVTRVHQDSNDKAEEDRIVNSIVQNLPDLSYMLRP